MNECVFERNRKCAALIVKNCENCKFRKTKEEFELGQKKAIEKVASMPYNRVKLFEELYHRKYEVSEND